MAYTINDLYQKYTNKIGKTLENDRYFQYLYSMIESSENKLLNQRQILHKVVDERWLSTIEESLDAINTIIEKPRRFVTTHEEVVPVSLAKKISADSVRHLSMNTQFIASDEGGQIQPTRILNVSTEESYDLYENRFIYHLIQRLVTFIDKRTDVIFWSTGDETTNTFSMESQVEDAYETIDYKIEMKVKNRQSFVENDTDNMKVFMRIDHVRRLVMGLRNSSFCSLMAGCAKVHSPIQRTNLMMKDPHYRTCYKLWQFLESYDEVGYTIDVKETPVEFDEEYLIQMYTNFITNYTVFKSVIESDTRKLDEIPAKRHRVIKPKFIKQIKEEIVEDRNIPEVEIRKVFLEEVTQAQLDAEEKANKLSEELERVSAAYDELEVNAQQSMMQVSSLMQTVMDNETALSQEREARENAEAERDQITAEAEEALNEKEAELAAKNEELEENIAKLEQVQEELRIKQAQAEEAIANLKAQMEEALKAKEIEANKKFEEALNRQRDVAAAALVKQKDEAKQMLEEKERIANQTMAKMEMDANEKLANEKREAAKKLEAQQREADEKLALALKKAKEDLDNQKKSSDEALANQKKEAKAVLDDSLAKLNMKLSAQKEEALQILKDKLEDEKQMAVLAVTDEKNQAINELNEENKQALSELETKKNEEIAAIKANHQKDMEALSEEKLQLLAAKDEKNKRRLAQKEEEYQKELDKANKEKDQLFKSIIDGEKAMCKLEDDYETLKKTLDLEIAERTKLEEKYRILKQKKGLAYMLRKKNSSSDDKKNRG